MRGRIFGIPMSQPYFIGCKKPIHLQEENEQVHGGKVYKARVTILVTVSAAGEKLPVLYIGKSKNPRWPVVMGKKANPPVDYDRSKRVDD